jgi:hypothetical protein
MTEYEKGFMSKCAEYGIPYGTASEMLSKSAGWGKWLARGAGVLGGTALVSNLLGSSRRGNTDYGSGAMDYLRTMRDHVTRGGMSDIARRQSQFNYDYNASGLPGRLWLRMKHPVRAAEARRARDLGVYGDNQYA